MDGEVKHRGKKNCMRTTKFVVIFIAFSRISCKSFIISYVIANIRNVILIFLNSINEIILSNEIIFIL